MVCGLQTLTTLPVFSLCKDTITVFVLLLLYMMYDSACCRCDNCPCESQHKLLNDNMICRVALLLQHQLRGQCEVAVMPAAAAVAAIAVLVPQVEVSLLTPAGPEVNISFQFAVMMHLPFECSTSLQA